MNTSYDERKSALESMSDKELHDEYKDAFGESAFPAIADNDATIKTILNKEYGEPLKFETIEYCNFCKENVTEIRTPVHQGSDGRLIFSYECAVCKKVVTVSGITPEDLRNNADTDDNSDYSELDS